MSYVFLNTLISSPHFISLVLWAVVNNAGVACFAEFEPCPKQAFQYTMDVNLMGLVNVTRTFLPLVRAAKGRIVNMASMAGMLYHNIKLYINIV